MASIPFENLTHTASDPITLNMLLGISVYGLFMGAGFIFMGLRGHQRWMVFWGAGLSICSLLYQASRLIS